MKEELTNNSPVNKMKVRFWITKDSKLTRSELLTKFSFGSWDMTNAFKKMNETIKKTQPSFLNMANKANESKDFMKLYSQRMSEIFNKK